MSRSRTVTSDISISGDVARVAEENPQAALMWPWFVTAVDDWGRMVADPMKVKLTVFPSFSFKASEIQEAMEAFSRPDEDGRSLAYLYTVDGRQYLQVNPETFYRLNHYVSYWKQVVDASKCPPPEEHPWSGYWLLRDTESTVKELIKRAAELKPPARKGKILERSEILDANDGREQTVVPSKPSPSKPTPSRRQSESLTTNPEAAGDGERDDDDQCLSPYWDGVTAILSAHRIDLSYKDFKAIVKLVDQGRVELGVVQAAADKTIGKDTPTGYFHTVWKDWRERGIRTAEQAREAVGTQDDRAGPG